jgi:linoleate 10R-lipoxygenase
MLTKLLFRTLPDHYPAGSAYAHFPFLVPEKIREWLGELDESAVHKYTWTRPLVPQALAVIDTYHEVSQILDDTDKFVSEYNSRLSVLTNGITLDRTAVRIFWLYYRTCADIFPRSVTCCLRMRHSRSGEARSPV